MASKNTTNNELRGQWKNPGDILSVLLLIGGDIVQKAVAQLVGSELLPFGYHRPKKNSQSTFGLPMVPVAFSFGWVAFSFTQLLAAVEKSAIIVNCANGFQRNNNSWILERLLRDHEACNPVDSAHISLRIDIFELGPLQKPVPDRVWWLGLLTILAQIAIAIPPWVFSNDWGTMMIILSGTLLAFVTCCLPQWKDEKWACRVLDKDNVTCLTRGNGYKHIMIFIGRAGSPDLETLATAVGTSRHETPILMVGLATLWVCLLLSVSSLKNNAWYMVGIGGLGMLQNVYAAGAIRHSKTTGLHLKPFERKSAILGECLPVTDENNADVDFIELDENVKPLADWLDTQSSAQMPAWLESMNASDGVPNWLEPVTRPGGVIRVHGALQELEKWVPGAGLAMIQVFFPSSFQYDDSRVRDNVDKKFWTRASKTRAIRRRAEQARQKILPAGHSASGP
ncbi:hypothetical protein D6D01_03705 [Aureobasidium pullulans]|uniref:Uncharacterized protein n=1 Tax=Aureobasidium pullulans TaxID=5580 RepID=A0A4S9LI48_AURPU|nr:hypothetical protein D6D01_03705 [Aureobasidium pullulans]